MIQKRDSTRLDLLAESKEQLRELAEQTRVHWLWRPKASFYGLYGKRLFDILASSLGLFLLFPLFVFCAFLIKRNSRGPVFFRQTRLGQNGDPFRLFKFRTMYLGSEQRSCYLTKCDDPRVTRIGRLLRNLKIDELPQLINVLRGEMSLVGPRARVPELLANYPVDLEVASLKPGMTGLSTLCYRNQESLLDSSEDLRCEPWYREKVSLENQYLRDMSFALDIKLVFLTLAILYLPGTDRLRSNNVLPQRVAASSWAVHVSLDLILICLALVASYWLRFEGRPSDFHLLQMYILLLLLPFLRILASHVLGVYGRLWRYTSVEDIAYLFFVHSMPTLLLLSVRLSIPAEGTLLRLFSVPLSIVALEYLGSSFLIASSRIGNHLLFEAAASYEPPQMDNFKRVVLVGAGSLGVAIARELRKLRHVDLLGFVDDDPVKRFFRFKGIPVLGTVSDLHHIVEQYDATHAVVCSPEGNGNLRRRAEEVLEGSVVRTVVTSAIDL